MDRRIFGAGLISTFALAGCSSTGSKFRRYDGPEVTSIVVNKSAQNMYLLNNNDILKAYSVDLGFAPTGPKRFEGDGKTPEGTYLIDRRNPNSAFHLSLGISYPNARDIAFAKSQGKKPGGDIFIHGLPNGQRRPPKKENWTAGCIAVKNDEMEEVYAMVRKGTVITIRA